MKKRLLPLLLCLAMMTSLAITAWAAPVEEDTDIPKLDASQLKAEWKKDQTFTLADPVPWNLSELKQVVDVKYITPSGVVSQQPQDGVNIVVKTLNDGSQTTVKRLGK